MPTKLGNTTQVNTYTTGEQRNPTLALLQNGNIVVVWESQLQDSSGYGIYAQIMDASNNKVGTEFQVHTTTALDQVFPSIFALQNGNFVIFWQTKTVASTQSGYDINGQIFNQTGSKVGSEFKVNNSTEVISSSSSTTMKIDTLPDGSFILMWKINGSPSIAAQKFDITADKIGTEFKINTTTTDTTVFPTTALKTGKFVSTYTKNDADSTGIFAQGFNSDGTLIVPEFQVNTFKLNSQNYPLLVPLKDGGCLIMWVSYGQVGTNYGIYGQRYDANFSKIGGEFLIKDSIYPLVFVYPPKILSEKSGRLILSYRNWHNQLSKESGKVFDTTNFEFSEEFYFPYGLFSSINTIQLPNKNLIQAYTSADSIGNGIYSQLYYGQLTLNNFNKTLNYTEDTTTKISNISILGAFNEDQVNVTLSLSNPAAGNFSFPVQNPSYLITNYDQQKGELNCSGSMINVNYFFSTLLSFIPTQNSGQNLTVSFNVTDNFSEPVSGQFNLTAIPVNDAPKIVNNQMTITQGNSIVLTQDNLSATDIDNPAGTLIFNVTSIQGGRFELIDFPGTAITNFTQQQVIDKKVQFVQDGTKSVSYYVSVSDGMLTTNPARATVNFVVVNPTPIATSTLTTTTALSSTSSSSTPVPRTPTPVTTTTLSSTSSSTPLPRTPTPVTTTLSSSGFFQPQPSSATTASLPSSSSSSSGNISISPGGMAGIVLGTIAGTMALTGFAVCGIFGINSLNRIRQPLKDGKPVTKPDNNNNTTSVQGMLTATNANNSTGTGSSSLSYTNLTSDSTYNS